MTKKKVEDVNAEVVNAESEDQAESEGPDEIRIAFDESVEDSHSEDEVKLAMIQAGATFSNVTRLYTQYMVDSGLLMSKEEKEELVSKVLVDADITSAEGFDDVIATLIEEGNNLTVRQASAVVRAYGKKNGIEVYKKPAGEGGGGKSGFRNIFLESLETNPAMTEDEAAAMLNTHELSSKSVRSRAPFFQRIRLMANRISGNA